MNSKDSNKLGLILQWLGVQEKKTFELKKCVINDNSNLTAALQTEEIITIQNT